MMPQLLKKVSFPVFKYSHRHHTHAHESDKYSSSSTKNRNLRDEELAAH